MLSLGIDPSLTSTGLCLLDSEDLLTYSRIKSGNLRGVERLVYIRQQLIEFINGKGTQISIGVLEGSAYGGKGRHHEIGEAHGVIKLTLHELGVRNTFIAAPSQLKKFGTGKGLLKDEEKKKLVLEAVCREFNIVPEKLNHDEADAIVLAQIGLALLDPNNYTKKHQQEVVTKILSTHGKNNS